MSRQAAPIVLSPDEQATLDTWVRRRRLPVRQVQRARIIQLAANGVESQDIAAAVGVSRPTVQLWRQRFLALRLGGLEKDAPRPGRIPRIAEKQVRAVVHATLHTKPPNATHWSTRTMAEAQGLSEATIRRIWKRHNLKPHLTKTFKLSRDTQFLEKLADIVGLYLNPPDRALVLCVDEKSQIQALDRTAPMLPMQPGLPERRTHDYKRNGTTTLFAALDIATGKVTAACKPRHRHQEFLAFLKQVAKAYPDDGSGQELHLVMDNYAAHKRIEIRDWLAANPRVHVHFTPTSGSWLNLVEVWFGIIERQAIHRGTFRSVRELNAKIRAFIDGWNDRAHPFVWTKTAEEILKKADRRNQKTTSATRH